MNLSPAAARLFRILVDEIGTGRFDPEDPDTFMGYGEALELMQLPATAPRGRTDGETLQENGMQNLAVSLFRHQAKPPAITALLVSKHQAGSRPPNLPGAGFFKVCGRKDEDWMWWLDQARRAIAFDWQPYLPPKLKTELPVMLDLLQRSLIEKAGYDNCWENVRESTAQHVVMFSARHNAEAHVLPTNNVGGPWRVEFPHGPSEAELVRDLPEMQRHDGGFEAGDLAGLGKLLRRAAQLAMSLPSHAANLYAEEIAKIEAEPTSTTEALRLVKQRVGQTLFRQALMDYWGGACAVTGLDLPEALRASHAKPWAACETDAERLDVFNGFLLSAQLDALFDQGFLAFSDEGSVILSARLSDSQIDLLGLDTAMMLRWLSPSHLPYLAWHRSKVFLG